MNIVETREKLESFWNQDMPVALRDPKGWAVPVCRVSKEGDGIDRRLVLSSAEDLSDGRDRMKCADLVVHLHRVEADSSHSLDMKVVLEKTAGGRTDLTGIGSEEVAPNQCAVPLEQNVETEDGRPRSRVVMLG